MLPSDSAEDIYYVGFVCKNFSQENEMKYSVASIPELFESEQFVRLLIYFEFGSKVALKLPRPGSEGCAFSGGGAAHQIADTKALICFMLF